MLPSSNEVTVNRDLIFPLFYSFVYIFMGRENPKPQKPQSLITHPQTVTVEKMPGTGQ